MAYLVPPNVILKYFRKFWSCCKAPEPLILHFLVLNESLEHRLNAILKFFCPRDHHFLRTKWNVPKFLILLSKIWSLPPNVDLKYFPESWSCLCTIMSFTIIGSDLALIMSQTEKLRTSKHLLCNKGRVKLVTLKHRLKIHL